LLLIKNTNDSENSISFTKILLYYILVVLSGLLLFYLIQCAPFILVSAFHFGDQQGLYLDFKVSKFLLIFYPFIYGIVILFLLFFFHANEVEEIVTEIIRFELPYYYINEIFIISAFLFISMSSYFYWKFESIRQNTCELFFYLFFAIIFKTSSLIWGFAIYFIIWHSIPSILDQIKFIYGSFFFTYFILLQERLCVLVGFINRYHFFISCLEIRKSLMLYFLISCSNHISSCGNIKNDASKDSKS
jgi:Brp/Blh family beta-carotene 15,15'-monooxygenase